MVHREGILVSTDGWVNTAAMGADIDEDLIRFRIFRPSDTAWNLKKNKEFTFSLTDDPMLFYKAALTGHDTQQPELLEDELVEEDGFYYPKKATRVFFCRVISTKDISIKDAFGSADLLTVEASIVRDTGEADFIGRENHLVDIMVHLTRYIISNEDKKEAIKMYVESILEDDDSPTAKKLIQWMEEQG